MLSLARTALRAHFAISGFESDLGFGTDEFLRRLAIRGAPLSLTVRSPESTLGQRDFPSADTTDFIDSSWGEGGFNIRVSQFVGLLREATNGTATFVGIPGDFNKNGILDASDVDLLAAEIRLPSGDMDYDLNGDGELTAEDHVSWVHELALTWFGDANLNGEFNSSDLVAVFAAGKYERDVVASWSEGDWNGDGRFGTGDLVAAFEDGGYEQGPRMAVNAVPEPASILILMGGLIGIAFCHRRNGLMIRRCARWRNASPAQAATFRFCGGGIRPTAVSRFRARRRFDIFGQLRSMSSRSGVSQDDTPLRLTKSSNCKRPMQPTARAILPKYERCVTCVTRPSCLSNRFDYNQASSIFDCRVPPLTSQSQTNSSSWCVGPGAFTQLGVRVVPLVGSVSPRTDCI